MTSLKTTVKLFVPERVLASYRNARLRWDMARAQGQSREEIFRDIYRNNRWGGDSGTYSSGTGSRPDVNASYIALVSSLICSERVRRVVDLGCGDFEVGRRLLSPEVKYIGCDIVPELVAHNAARFATKCIEFRTLDAVTDPLPEGDLCIIRQVFQHLSNSDIAKVLRKCRQYRLLLVTDEQVINDKSDCNAEILAYHGTRRVFGQGLKLERAPFFEPIEILLEHPSSSDCVGTGGTYLRTVLIRRTNGPNGASLSSTGITSGMDRNLDE
jgi:SAM-dependent methyltransferase